MPKDHVVVIVDKSIADANGNPEALADLCDKLNKKFEKDAFDEGPVLVTNDQILMNIKSMMEEKGEFLNTVSPDILNHIHKFADLNNLEKKPDVDM